MSRVLGKQDFHKGENKSADQLRSNCVADQRLRFRSIDSTTPLHFKALAIFSGCTARFVSDLVGNPGPVFYERSSYLN